METKIIKALNEFRSINGHKPSRLYLGYNEWINLKDEIHLKHGFNFSSNSGNEIFGLTVHIVNEESHFNIT